MRVRLAVIMAVVPLLAAGKAPKPPRDAPFCAAPKTRPVFISPMGEPFRATPGQAYPSTLWFAAADRNHDGAIDRAEFVADARRFFQRLDIDGDHRLTPEEVIAYEQSVAPEIALYSARPQIGEAASSRRRGGPGLVTELGLSGGAVAEDYGGPMGAGRYAWLNVPEPVASADLDVNRVVDESEFLAAASRRFDALDTKGEGALRLADLPRTPAQIAIEGPCRPRPKPRRGDVSVDHPYDQDDTR